MSLKFGTCRAAALLNRSTDGFRFERADDRPCIHDARRIERNLDAAHRSDAAGVSIFLQEMPLEPADAMLRTERAPERGGRVIKLERKAAFDKPREFDAIGTAGDQNIVMQIAVTYVAVDGKLEVGAIVLHLFAGDVQEPLDRGQGHGDIVLDGSTPS